jgi:hypothetical protein
MKWYVKGKQVKYYKEIERTWRVFLDFIKMWGVMWGVTTMPQRSNQPDKCGELCSPQ